MFKILSLTMFSITILFSNNIVIKGQDNQEITLKSSAKKVLLFPFPFASMYISMDNGTQNISGVHGSANKSLKDSFMINAYPQIDKLNTELAQQGFIPNIEQVISLKPDVIFQWADQGEHLIKPLRNVGLNVIGVKYGTQEYLEEWIELMGKTTANHIKANEILKWHKDIKEKLSKLSSSKTTKPKILSLQFSKDRFRVAGNGSYDNFIIELIGAENPAKNDIQRFADISKEQLLKYNPDVIILGNFDEQTPDELMSLEIFKNMNAVKTKQVYKLPTGGYRWGVPHIEIPLTWTWLYKLVYEDKSINLVKDMKKAYKMLYSYEIKDEEIEKILNFDIQKNSKNYHLLLD